MNKAELAIEKHKLLIDYGKSVSTLFLAALGAQVTLLGSVFKEVFEKNQYLSMASLLLMLFAAMTALGISEAVPEDLLVLLSLSLGSQTNCWADSRRAKTGCI